MKATDQEKALAAEIWRRFHEEDYDQAVTLLGEALKTSGHPRFKRIQARFSLFDGDEAEASGIIRSLLPDVWHPGSWEVALAANGSCRARILKAQKILYFPLRKCGSTSLMNLMKIIAGEDVKGEEVHHEDYKKTPIKLSEMARNYDGFFKFSVVRSPVDRLMSFYRGNIVARDQLMVEHGGATQFYGLPTKPDLGFFLENLTRYRQVFISVRDHTEPLTASIGTDPKLFDWVGGLHQLPDLVAQLSAHTGVELPLLQEMATPNKTNEPTPVMPEAVQALYAADYDVYGQFF